MVPVPSARARAIDAQGNVFALEDDAVRDETMRTRTALSARMPPCPVQRDALAFGNDGSAVAVLRGRVYVRPRVGDWTETPACTDLFGEPWAQRTHAPGWMLVGRRTPGTQPALLATNDPTARAGWYAITALRADTRALLLDGVGTFLVLDHGHAVVVDHERSVAGAVLGAEDRTWDSLTRTRVGMVLAADDGEGARDVATARGLFDRIERSRRARPAGARTTAVFVVDYGRMLAVTDRGIEWTARPGGDFEAVAAWPAGGGDWAAGAALGWLSNGDVAVVGRRVLVTATCDR